jgi:hypothetical protein
LRPTKSKNSASEEESPKRFQTILAPFTHSSGNLHSHRSIESRLEPCSLHSNPGSFSAQWWAPVPDRGLNRYAGSDSVHIGSLDRARYPTREPSRRYNFLLAVRRANLPSAPCRCNPYAPRKECRWAGSDGTPRTSTPAVRGCHCLLDHLVLTLRPARPLAVE